MFCPAVRTPATRIYVQRSLSLKRFDKPALGYLTREEVTALLDAPDPDSWSVSPHTIRHTTAMHLLQSGVDIAVIALWLGHEDTATTHIYLSGSTPQTCGCLNARTVMSGSST